MKRTYGKVCFQDGGDLPQWRIEAEPQILIVLKNVFPRVAKGVRGEVTILDSDEVCRNIEWFLSRYDLEVPARERRILRERSRRHKDTILRMEEILGRKHRRRAVPLAIPARDYQTQAAELWVARKGLLIGDDLGLGKTVEALAAWALEPKMLPAVVVCLAGRMPYQWEANIRKFLPQASSHVIEKVKPYELPKFMGKAPDILIITYHKLHAWANIIANYVRSVVFDEAQELRRTESAKYEAAKRLAERSRWRLGLSATPIMNYGGEIWNVMDVLAPGLLGTWEEFKREWCSGWGRSWKLDDPDAFGSYAREQFLLLRRTRLEVGRELPPLTKIPQPVDSDRAPIDGVETAARELAKIILAGQDLEQGEAMQAAGELDWKLRHATGVAKAPHVADFVRILIENGERVVIFAWHRTVYDILNERLSDYKPANYSGEESVPQKNESFRRFTEKETPIILISLRAGQGLDGFQHGARTVVFAELDWSYGIMEQCIGRVHRDGQKEPVTAYFMVSDKGSDPVVAEALGLKGDQLEGIRNPGRELFQRLQSETGRAESLARHFLKERGISLPLPAPAPAQPPIEASQA